MNDGDEDESSKYDPNVIIRAADEKRKMNDIGGAQMMYMSALLDWVDAAREGGVRDPDQVREAIATLWLAYAQFNQSANMFKSATEAYEQAVSCPVAGSVGRVWLDYARFAQERDKLRTAQKIYLRALVGDKSKPAAVTDEQDRNLLWSEFLEMMRQTKPELTMMQLKQAVELEHQQPSAEDPLEDIAAPDPISSAANMEEIVERPEKRRRLDEAPSETKRHVVTAQTVAAEATDLLASTQGGLPPEISAAWFVRDGDSLPSPPEPPLFVASPPKLADPTGKEILGTEMALGVITRLLKKNEEDPSGTKLLEVCRGLWMLTALKEKEAATAIDRVDQSIYVEMENLESSLEARLSVAGAASSAVQQMNDNERNAFQQSSYQRRQEVLSSIAWDFRNLLCIQQQVLTKLQVPGFDGPAVDASALDLHARMCSYLHSAFYLRARIGEGPHQTMLKSQAERLKRDMASQKPSTQPSISSLPPPPPPQFTTQLPPPPMYNPGFPPPQQQYQPGMYVQQQYPGQVMQGMPQGAPQGNPYGQPHPQYYHQ